MSFVVEKGVDFVDQVLYNKFKLNSSVDIDFRFGPLIKGQCNTWSIDQILLSCQKIGIPRALEQRQYIKFDGDVIRLAKEPKEDEIGLQDSRKSVLKSDYESLNQIKSHYSNLRQLLGINLMQNFWQKSG